MKEEEVIQQFQQFQPTTPKELNWEICWQDFGITPEFLSQLQPHQRVNHFLGMYNIARKNTLSIHLKRFQKEFARDYEFFPKTWLYPQDFYDIQEYFNEVELTLELDWTLQNVIVIGNRICKENNE